MTLCLNAVLSLFLRVLRVDSFVTLWHPKPVGCRLLAVGIRLVRRLKDKISLKVELSSVQFS
jgi:hypothetical protein